MKHDKDKKIYVFEYLKSYVYLQKHVLDIHVHVHVFTLRFCMHEKLQYANFKSLYCIYSCFIDLCIH